MSSVQIHPLLSQINALNKRFLLINRLSGDNFNIFKILKLQTSEVRLHSIFLAELLSPKGSHENGDAFLKLFVDRFCKASKKFQTQDSIVEVEKYIGLINQDQSEGGRIDIVITDRRNNRIVIENKIYAPDQVNQLQRYKTRFPDCELFYLTLNGHGAHLLTKGNLIDHEDYKLLSYKVDIMGWLEDCRKESAMQPLLRETITQYINLIKYFTGLTVNDTMQEELSDIVLNNLQAAFTITNNIDQITNKLLENLKRYVFEISEELADLGIEVQYFINVKDKYTGFHFFLPDWEYLNIGFQFQDYFRKFVYGLTTNEDPRTSPLPPTILDKIKSVTGEPSKLDSWWPLSFQLEAPFDKDWNIAYEPWQALYDGSFKDVIKRKLLEIIELTKGLKL